MELSDRELLLDCRRGSESAWEALVHRYKRLIYTIPRRAGLDEDAAAEVIQEVFATLLEKIDEIEQPERLHAWLVTTARHKTWRAIARARHFESTIDEEYEVLSGIHDNAPLPDETLAQLEEQHRVRSAVDALDERCRRLVQMLYYEEETPSYKEIAAEINVPEGSIGPTRARCLKKLLRLLTESNR